MQQRINRHKPIHAALQVLINLCLHQRVAVQPRAVVFLALAQVVAVHLAAQQAQVHHQVQEVNYGTCRKS